MMVVENQHDNITMATHCTVWLPEDDLDLAMEELPDSLAARCEDVLEGFSDGGRLDFS